jgi:aspartate aminotransferase
LAEYSYTTLTEAGADLHRAAGGFYLFPRFEKLREAMQQRGIGDGETFCTRLLDETGVAALPGHCFGRPASELSTRLAIVDFDGEKALEKANDEPVDLAFARRYCANVTDAIDQLAAWVSS